jgi:hypothetical protein
MLSGRVVLVLHYPNKAGPFLHLLTRISFFGCSKTLQEVQELYYLGRRINYSDIYPIILILLGNLSVSILKHTDHHYSFLCHLAATKHITVAVMYLNSMLTDRWNVCKRLKSQQHGTSVYTVYYSWNFLSKVEHTILWMGVRVEAVWRLTLCVMYGESHVDEVMYMSRPYSNERPLSKTWSLLFSQRCMYLNIRRTNLTFGTSCQTFNGSTFLPL